MEGWENYSVEAKRVAKVQRWGDREEFKKVRKREYWGMLQFLFTNEWKFQGNVFCKYDGRECNVWTDM